MIFEVKKGCFGYSKTTHTLTDIDFSIREGEVLSILGCNGAGKTTLLRCLLGLLKWKHGGSIVDGGPLEKMNSKELWKKIGYVPQAKLSSFVYSVTDMVLLGRSAHLGMFEQPNENDVAIACSAMDKIGILHLKDKLCGQISGGELQMVLIARALAAEPSMLILDEPESNLDFKNQMIVLDTIKSLKQDHGIGSIVNTHYPEHAIDVSDFALILQKDGRAIFGPAKEVITEQNLSAAFGVDVSIMDVEKRGRKYTCVRPIPAGCAV